LTGVFICCRRDDTAGYASRIYDRLGATLGRRNVFLDVDTIDVGIDFVATINDILKKSDVMLVVIGTEWLRLTQAAQSKAVRDFVYLEIGTAIRGGVPICPVW
jgi:hypothetical protein